MNRLTLSLLLFFAALTVPTVYLVVHTYRGVNQEEVTEFTYFANSLFDRMDESVLGFLAREENREVDEYLSGTGSLALATESYIYGHYQVAPDGRITVAHSRHQELPEGLPGVTTKLKEEEASKTKSSRPLSAKSSAYDDQRLKKSAGSRLSEKYFNNPRTSLKEDPRPQEPQRLKSVDKERAERFVSSARQASSPEAIQAEQPLSRSITMEVGPLEITRINNKQIFLYRRIFVAGSFYIQGVVVDIESLIRSLAGDLFSGQPIETFANLSMRTVQGDSVAAVAAWGVDMAWGVDVESPEVAVHHELPRPFNFIRGTITCSDVPRDPVRDSLTAAVLFMVAVIILGLLAIYISVRNVLELSRRRAGFVSSVTHELKTPLTNIRMYVEMLQQGIGTSREKEEKYLDTISTESARLTRLINDVLEFSRLEAGTRGMEMEEGDVRRAVTEAARLIRPRLQEASFTLSINDGDVAEARYDHEALVQVLINLMENSLKFGAGREFCEISLGVERTANGVRVTVSDTGPGIPASAQERVFEDFYRVEQGLARKTKGAGIGLAVVRKLVQAMGGKVSVKNNPDMGCIFTIELKRK